MKVAIMQPYFMPYLGYWQLINAVDEFILLKDVQFIYHGWIERNRILNQTGDWVYIKVPLKKNTRDTLISDVSINNEEQWREKIFSQLTHYKKKSKYYFNTIKILKESLDIETDDITLLNKHILEHICNYFKIETKITIYDKNILPINYVNNPDEWALNICLAMDNVKTYINPEGGVTFFDCAKYHKNNIDIKFLKSDLPVYNQGCNNFINGLSIIDIMMFNSVDEIKDMLDKFSLIGE